MQKNSHRPFIVFIICFCLWMKPHLPDLLLSLPIVLLSLKDLFLDARSSEVVFLKGTVLHLDRDEAVVFKEAKKRKIKLIKNKNYHTDSIYSNKSAKLLSLLPIIIIKKIIINIID